MHVYRCCRLGNTRDTSLDAALRLESWSNSDASSCSAVRAKCHKHDVIVPCYARRDVNDHTVRLVAESMLNMKDQR